MLRTELTHTHTHVCVVSGGTFYPEDGFKKLARNCFNLNCDVNRLTGNTTTAVFIEVMFKKNLAYVYFRSSVVASVRLPPLEEAAEHVDACLRWRAG